MGRTAKIAVAGVFGGMALAVTAGVALIGNRPAQPLDAPERKTVDTSVEADLRRCRTLTMPDAGCEAAWEARRRRFFGQDDKP